MMPPELQGYRHGLHKRYCAALAVSLVCLMFNGCGANSINVMGSYFPVWLICMICGVVIAFGCRMIFMRLRIEPYVGPLTLIYLCIMVGASCLMWLLFA
jgi:hypothetical protein